MKFCFLLFFPTLTIGQTITGEVINKTSKEKIPFVTIGLLKANKGTNADEQRKFTLISNLKHDTLLFSSVGYETLKIPAADATSFIYVEMQEKQMNLKEVILTSFKQTVALNDFSNCGIHSYTSTGSITQVAQHLQAPKVSSLLSEVHICKTAGDALFRIRVYDFDSLTGSPSKDLTDTVIEVRSSKRHVYIDMEKYRIIIPGKDFFVAVEWIYIPSNEIKSKGKINGVKIKNILYSPFIFFKDVPPSENFLEALQLDYRGKWQSFFINKKALLISSKVKY